MRPSLADGFARAVCALAACTYVHVLPKKDANAPARTAAVDPVVVCGKIAVAFFLRWGQQMLGKLAHRRGLLLDGADGVPPRVRRLPPRDARADEKREQEADHHDW